ncbi:esterase [Burkholderia sp. WAC0059]|uniref:YqiA/YcfP family alpha/beta fold hydrolase n=1 Tax=Burkholderia sp. WAC0059 TaxID=2066022 RepID=UPI000C7F0F64|nr:YqiA/YcfP family alpha/beta fold hydrolase [Burkholderia sp. WAC0059]PLZ01638.1 esterase [Burkholderia sp. WAC0059]
MIVYLHGFRSSPQSFKARLLAARLGQTGREREWRCPALPVSPAEAVALVEREVEREVERGGDPRGGPKTQATGGAADPADVTLIGSSLGGYYATYLAEKHGWRAVLLNPAVVPQRDLGRRLGEQPLWHGGGSIVVEPRHLDELRALAVTSVTRPERYYLFAATGDEVLDYREMLAHYPGVRTRLIEGSDHGISEFADYVDDVIAFCGAAPRAG